MIPNERRYAVRDMKKSLSFDIAKPDDMIKYEIFCFNLKMI